MIAVIILSMIVMSSFIVLISINSLMKQSVDFVSFNEAKQAMADLDSVVRQLLFESPGSSAEFSMDLEKGEFFSDDAKNRFYIELDTEAVDAQTLVKEGPIRIERGPFVDAYEADVDGDGSSDLVLENNALLFAVAKIGNATSEQEIDFGRIIRQMKVKQTGFTAVPAARMFINSVNSTSGTGYTALVEKGSLLPSSSILVHIDSGNSEYDAIFTLNAANDFIEMKVKTI